jgi:uncharacterized membrane protein
LFWLSLIPVTTAWLGDHPRAAWPAALYGMVLLLAAIAWILLERAILRLKGASSVPAGARGRDFKGKISLGFYLAAVGASFLRPWIADLLYASVAVLWIVPDPRIEKRKHHG